MMISRPKKLYVGSIHRNGRAVNKMSGGSEAIFELAISVHL